MDCRRSRAFGGGEREKGSLWDLGFSVGGLERREGGLGKKKEKKGNKAGYEKEWEQQKRMKKQKKTEKLKKQFCEFLGFLGSKACAARVPRTVPLLESISFLCLVPWLQDWQGMAR